MRLIQFSVQKYRSIIKSERLPLRDFTVLVGPNNEGKSNLLQALVSGVQILSRTQLRVAPARLRRRGNRLLGRYDWERDYPRGLQQLEPTGRSIFNFDFELNTAEIADFEHEVGSKLNGILPLSLSFGADNAALFSVRKQRHSAALSAKRNEIADFVANRVSLQYVPAARTAEAGLDVVDSLVRDVLVAAESDPEYRDALATIRKVQQALIQQLADSLKTSLHQLLPDVGSVSIETDDDRRTASPFGLGHCRLVVDDGTATDLEFKGDGIQSLATLSLIRFHSEQRAPGKQVILAVEEPEAHLHPRAIHEVKEVLQQTAERQQVVVATHSPLLVNRFDIESNILVERTRARPASNLRELREMLGVRISDNLAHAEVVLVVEGSEDEVALRSVLGQRSSKLRVALEDGVLALQPLFGGAKLSYALSQLQHALCRPHVLVDDDRAGKEAVKKAQEEGLLVFADQTFARFPGAPESELEDMYRPEVYAETLQQTLGLGIDAFSAIKRNKGKWSNRMKLLCNASGKAWDDQIEALLKARVAAAVAGTPRDAVQAKCEGVIVGLVEALEEKLAASAV